MVEEELDRLIRRWTLANALEHSGSASANAVIGKLIAEDPGLKENIPGLKRRIEVEVNRVNSLSEGEKKSELEEVGKPEREEREEKGLQELPEKDRYSSIVTRFAPNPNGPLHLGHIRTAVLSHEYARRNDGKFILRFEDTNPHNAKADMYNFIKKDLKWLGTEWDEEYIQSDRLDLYYEIVEEVLKDGNAYVCTCPPEKFRSFRDDQEPCPCRSLSPEDNLARWRGMVEGEYDEGEAAVRIRTDLDNPNPALRDWPAFRIVKASHPRTGDKYRVWPLYNFSVAVDDHKMGITHVLRGKEHEVNEQRQRQLFEHLGWNYPTAIQHGRLSISDAVLSKTKIMEGIQNGEYEGYDDLRLGTIAAARRRGITSKALKEMVLDIGTTRNDSVLSWENLYTKNRRIIDERANRYYFVKDPMKLTVSKAPDKDEAHLQLHPDDPDRGERVLPLNTENGDLKTWISSQDVEGFSVGDKVRLKDLFNFELISLRPLEAKFAGFELADVPKIQWVSGNPVEVEILRSDGSKDRGYAEPEVKELSEGEIIQFERYGFVRLDEKEPQMRFAYAHT